MERKSCDGLRTMDTDLFIYFFLMLILKKEYIGRKIL